MKMTPTSRASRRKAHSLCNAGTLHQLWGAGGLTFLPPDCRGSEGQCSPTTSPRPLTLQSHSILTSLNSLIECIENPPFSHTHSCRECVCASSRRGSQTPTIRIQRFNKETKHKHSTDACAVDGGDGFIWKAVNSRVSSILLPVIHILNKQSSEAGDNVTAAERQSY